MSFYRCLIGFVFLLSSTTISANNWVPPQEETLTSTWTYLWPSRVYFQDLDEAENFYCDRFEEGYSGSLNAGIGAVYYCPVNGVNLITERENYRRYQARAELWQYNETYPNGRVIGGVPFLITQDDYQEQVCPTTHPIAIDTNQDGTIDACTPAACPDTGQASADAASASSSSSESTDFPWQALIRGAIGLVGNPVSCATGQKIESQAIYTGTGSDALHYSLHYKSPKHDSASGSNNSSAINQFIDNHRRKLSLIYSENGGKIYQISGKNNNRHYFSGSDTNTSFGGKFKKSGDLSIETNGQLKHTTPKGVSYLYNPNGQLLSRALANGQTRHYTYTATDKLATVTNHYGQQLQYFYNSDDLLNQLIAPDNREYFFEYDSNHNLIKITYPDDTPLDLTDNPSIHYLFENANFPNHLTGKINEKGVQLATWHYDSEGRAISSEHANGLEKVELDYSVDNQTRVTTHINNTLSNDSIYHYTTRYVNGSPKKQLSQFEQVACTDCTVGSWYYGYDANGYIGKSTSPGGHLTYFIHDDNGLETRRTLAVDTDEETTLHTVWDTNTRRVTSSTNGNLKTDYSYNAIGQQTSVTVTDLTNNQTRTTTYTYGSAGVIDSIDGTRTDINDITTFNYHLTGNLHTLTNGLGQVTTFDNYDNNGRAGSITDANGVVTTLTYHPRGWLESSTINGALTQYDYFPTGSVKQITAPSGQTINYEYDDGERLIAIENNEGHRIEYTRDLMGNITQTNTKDSNGVLKHQQTAVFNALGQLKQSLGNHGQSNELNFDAEGNVTNNTNANNDSTNNSFDALNRLTQSIDANLGETNFTYNTQNQLTSVEDAEGKTTQYEYNAFGEVTRLISPDTGETTYTYDKAGNLLTKTDARGITVTFTYDALNRPLTQSYADTSENIMFTYDDTSNGNQGIGRLTKVTDQTGETHYVYNAFGQITKETRIINGQSYVTESHFDQYGQMTGMRYPSGKTISYSRDSLGRVSGLTLIDDAQTPVQTTLLANNINYLPFGPLSHLTYGHGKVLTQSYDLDYRLTDKTTSGLSQQDYHFDVINNITAITNNAQTSQNQSFVYDKLSRLTTGNGNYGVLDFIYDQIGNRQSDSDNSNNSSNTDNYVYASTSHQLQSITGINPNSFTYDASGNTIQKGSIQFTYNQANRLSQTIHGTTISQYTYNAKGERSIKLSHGVETHYIYNLQGQLMAEANDQGVIQKEYVYLNGQPFAQLIGSDVYYYHNSHLGTPEMMTDASQNVVWQASYTPFGLATVTVDTIENNIRFPGQYFDSETGMHYNYFRDYDPEIGRYLQSDPIGLNGGINTYGYVGGNPLRYSDPYGLVRWTGTVSGFELALFGRYYFNLTSDCVDGKEVNVEVTATGVGLGLGIEFSSTSSTLTLNDPWNHPDPDSFNSDTGGFSMVGTGISIPPSPEVQTGALIADSNYNPATAPHGVGTDHINLGWASGSSDPTQRGFQISAGGLAGWSEVTSTKSIECGCDSE